MGVYDPFLQSEAPLRLGDKGQRVKDLQQGLRDAARKLMRYQYEMVDPTGVYDPKTEAAVKSFQQDWGLTANGVADRDVQYALFLARTPLGRFHDLGLVKNRILQHIISTMGSVPEVPMTPCPVSGLSSSTQARRWMFFDETSNAYEVTAYLHFPGKPEDPHNGSGVTLGPGYDMHYQSHIKDDLISIGVDPAIAAKVEDEVPNLQHFEAKAYADKYGAKGSKLIHLSPEQQFALQARYLPNYEKLIKRFIHVPLMQWEFEALVSFVMNPGGKMAPIDTYLNQGQVAASLEAMLNRLPKDGADRKGIINRRRREVEWFISGRYSL